MQMLHRSRLASLAEPDARIAHAEAVVRRHAGLVAQAAKGSDEARRARGLLAAAEERLDLLGRSRDVLLGGDEGREECRVCVDQVTRALVGSQR
jgi:hypothetical protein